jgi:trigger factor
MKIQVEKVSPVESKVTIEVDPERVAQEIDRAYSGLGRRVKLRGFRPGKAPRKVLERYFRAEVETEVSEKIVQQAFAEAVKVEAIAPVAPPQVSISEGVAEGKPMRFTARVEVKPIVDPKEYKGLAVERKVGEVKDDMVSAELTRLQNQFAQIVPVEGRFEAQEGDWAVIDHEGTIDGKPFDGSKAEGVTVQVVAGAISDGNFELLKGKKLGETVEFEERFPEDHRVEALRGKVAKMTATLKALNTRLVPSLDDAFAKQIGVEGIETLDQLRARIRSDMEKAQARVADAEFKNALVKEALSKNEFEVPPAMVERAIDVLIEGATQRFAQSGIDMSELQLDYARMRADLRDQALFHVRGRLLLEAIAEAEKVEATEEDFQAEAARIAEEAGAPLAKVQQQMRGKEAREALRNKIKEDKVLALMSSAATIKPA